MHERKPIQSFLTERTEKRMQETKDFLATLRTFPEGTIFQATMLEHSCGVPRGTSFLRIFDLVACGIMEKLGNRRGYKLIKGTPDSAVDLLKPRGEKRVIVESAPLEVTRYEQQQNFLFAIQVARVPDNPNRFNRFHIQGTLKP